MCHAVPYRYYTKLMVQALIACMIEWINAFPTKTGISDKMGHAMIVTGKSNPNMDSKRIIFGSYAVSYKGTKNNMSGRGIPAITLRESNDAGGYYFMSLETGERLHCHIWTD